jgi:hypothetical protein
MKLARLVRFYPARWRERYGEEIADLLATEPPSVPRAVDMLRGLIDAHLHPELVHSALAAVPAAGERPAEMRTHGTGTVARLARVAMLTGLIVTPLATGAVGYYLGRSQVSPVAELPVVDTVWLGTVYVLDEHGGVWRECVRVQQAVPQSIIETFTRLCSNP